MARISTNLPISNIETTIQYFATLQNRPIQVSQNTMDIVYSFFIDKADNENAALAMVHSVLITALDHGVDPLEVISEFEKYDGLELDQRLAAFMNISRNNTSVLGVANFPSVNYHIARTILA